MAKREIKTSDLTIGDLQETHELYDVNLYEWKYLLAMYEGLRGILRLGLISRHERESLISYQRRKEELVCFEYCKSIVEIFHFFLFKKSPDRTLSSLNTDPLWNMFMEDADLYGNDLDAIVMEISLYASIFGHMGVLVDKSSKKFASVAEQIKEEVYPYIAKYYPSAILDWYWERDENNRPYLKYLKLLDDDGQYRIWTDEEWSIWEIPDRKKKKQSEHATLIAKEKHSLGLIPFIWHYNYKSTKLGIGSSDIHGISRIDLSLTRNLSQIEQIINYAAHPMMRKPLRSAMPTDMNAPQQEDEVGVEVILEFDPENPDSKPDWLSTEVADPVEAILHFIEKKISEIYRAANVGGMAATEPTKNNLSGISKRIDFNLLNSKITSKAINLEDTEKRILEYWLRWENKWEQLKGDVAITRKRNYDIEDLASMLDNALTAKTLVVSKTFSALLQKSIVRATLQSATEEEFGIIDEEIDKNTKEPFVFDEEDKSDLPPENIFEKES